MPNTPYYFCSAFLSRLNNDPCYKILVTACPSFLLAPVFQRHSNSLFVRFSRAELLGSASVGTPALELTNGVAHGGAGLQGHSTNIALGTWIWKPAARVVRVKFLGLARGGRQEARLPLRVGGQVRERIQDIQARGPWKGAELLAE